MVTISPPNKKSACEVPRNHVLIESDSPQDTFDSLDERVIKDLYRQHGALVFRGFPLDLTTFTRFSSVFCSHTVINKAGNRGLVDAANNIQTVNRGAGVFPLHPELSYEPWRPDVCFFGCLTPPPTGGETTFCDGVSIVQKLPPTSAKILASRQLKYTSETSDRGRRFWLGEDQPSDTLLDNPPANCPYTFSRQSGKILKTFTTPVFNKPMFLDKPAFGSFLLFARGKHNNRAFPMLDNDTPVPDHLVTDLKNVSDKLTYAHQWRSNDLVMLDNTRFMHGRNRVVGVSQRLILSRFGYLKFARPGSHEVAGAPWRIPGGMDELWSA